MQEPHLLGSEPPLTSTSNPRISRRPSWGSLIRSERVWTFGNGTFGQLGHVKGTDEMVPQMVELVDVKVTQIAAGDRHTVICTAQGSVIIFGVLKKANRLPLAVNITIDGSWLVGKAFVQP